jgi:hypothetical protein
VVDREGRGRLGALLGVAAVPPRAVQASRQRFAGREQVEQFHRQRGEAEGRGLHAAVGVEQARARHAHARVLVEKRRQRLDRAGLHNGVGVEQ